MYKEYEVVEARKDLSEDVKAGAKGTIVMVYTDPNLAYEVEFMDENGTTLGLFTVMEEDIKPWVREE